MLVRWAGTSPIIGIPWSRFLRRLGNILGHNREMKWISAWFRYRRGEVRGLHRLLRDPGAIAGCRKCYQRHYGSARPRQLLGRDSICFEVRSLMSLFPVRMLDQANLRGLRGAFRAGEMDRVVLYSTRNMGPFTRERRWI